MKRSYLVLHLSTAVLAAFLGCLLAGPLAAAVSARKLSRADTGLILREG